MGKENSIKLFALTSAVAAHAGMAAWALQPSAPIAIPQQQVIQVAMVAAPAAQKVATVAPPPKPKAMQKIQQHNKPSTPSSGPQAATATAQQAAISEPVNAAYLRNTPPVYPPAARRRNQEGKVVLNVQVTQEGAVANVTIARSSGVGMLDEAARIAVEKWRFIPARRGSEPVAASVKVPIIFRLGEAR